MKLAPDTHTIDISTTVHSHWGCISLLKLIKANKKHLLTLSHRISNKMKTKNEDQHCSLSFDCLHFSVTASSKLWVDTPCIASHRCWQSRPDLPRWLHVRFHPKTTLLQPSLHHLCSRWVRTAWRKGRRALKCAFHVYMFVSPRRWQWILSTHCHRRTLPLLPAGNTPPHGPDCGFHWLFCEKSGELLILLYNIIFLSYKISFIKTLFSRSPPRASHSSLWLLQTRAHQGSSSHYIWFAEGEHKVKTLFFSPTVKRKEAGDNVFVSVC